MTKADVHKEKVAAKDEHPIAHAAQSAAKRDDLPTADEVKRVPSDEGAEKAKKPDSLPAVLEEWMAHVHEVLDRTDSSPQPADVAIRSKLVGRLRALHK